MKEKLIKIIELHELMKNVYFFNTEMKNKEAYEKAHSLITTFEYKSKLYMVTQVTKCETDYVSYRVEYYCESQKIKADIRLIKKILREISAL